MDPAVFREAALEAYESDRWRRVFLWHIDEFVPSEVAAATDGVWEADIARPLPKRFIHLSLAAMTLWGDAEELTTADAMVGSGGPDAAPGDDLKVRLHALVTILRNKDLLAVALRNVASVLEIEPITRDDINYDPELQSRWDHQEAIVAAAAPSEAAADIQISLD